MASETRSKMIEATVDALRHHGVSGMSFTEVLDASGAARGAIYHHFPGGKAQLVAEAAEHDGRDVTTALAGLPATSPRAVVDGFIRAVRPVVAAAAGGCGCAVAAVTVDADLDTDELRSVAARAFSSWIEQLAAHLHTAGMTRTAATGLATTLVALLEGAQVLCRAAQSTDPLDPIAHAMRSLAPGPSKPPGRR
jgi:TetR/AcrR family transcriptional repressor of lmrAB and yxaGH operons